MSDTVLQLTKRELHGVMTCRPIWMGCVAAGVLLGLTGPFGTDEAMRLIPRIVYWVFVACLTYASGVILSAVVRQRLSGGSAWLIIAISAVLTGIVVLGEVTALNALLFGRLPGPAEVLTLGANIMAVAAVVHVAGWVIATDLAEAPDAAAAPARPPIMDRLPLDKRGPLVSMSAVDHYVEVTTTKGTELLLMRLTDAIAETTPTEGLQVHRSHWVAQDHVTAVRREGGRTLVQLSDGRTLPVSRSNLPALRGAGLMAG